MTVDRRPDLCSDCGEPLEPHDGDPEDRPSCPECGSTDRTIRVHAQDSISVSGEVQSYYVYASYAEEWWEDACRNVPGRRDESGATRDAIRRQIVFAVCALESWFFEWVRDELVDDTGQSSVLFSQAPPPIADRIKFVLDKLHGRGKLVEEPEFGASEAWDDLHDLLSHRNGLVHALASWPRGTVPADADEARPTPQELSGLAPARPLEVVRGVADFLTSFADDEPPEWMEVPA